tara:strand:- start:81 stop:404 length:324 start_codon:yes stop_codon:yes gene_type:complete
MIKAQIRHALRGQVPLLTQFVPLLFFLKKMITKHFVRKKDIATPTPKKSGPGYIYTTPQKILANLEVLMKVARERFHVPPWIQLSSFLAFSRKGGSGTMCKFCVNNV